MSASSWEFKSPPRHHKPAYLGKAYLVIGSIKTEGKFTSLVGKGGSGSAVEYLLAKERVASSNLVFRSNEVGESGAT